MSGVNKAIIVGNLGMDPDIRYTPSGTCVANFSVATSEQWKDKDSGQKKERTEWHNIVFFGRQAEVVQEYLRKGSQVYVEGKLQTDKYEKDGVTRYSTKINGYVLQMLGGKQKQQDQNIDRGAAPPADEFDDDIPF